MLLSCAGAACRQLPAQNQRLAGVVRLAGRRSLPIGYLTLAAADEAFVRKSGQATIRVRELAGGCLLPDWACTRTCEVSLLPGWSASRGASTLRQEASTAAGRAATLSTVAAVTAAVAVAAAIWAPTKRSSGAAAAAAAGSIGLGHDSSFRWCAVAARVQGGPGAPGKGKQTPTLRTRIRCRQVP